MQLLSQHVEQTAAASYTDASSDWSYQVAEGLHNHVHSEGALSIPLSYNNFRLEAL